LVIGFKNFFGEYNVGAIILNTMEGWSQKFEPPKPNKRKFIDCPRWYCNNNLVN